MHGLHAPLMAAALHVRMQVTQHGLGLHNITMMTIYSLYLVISRTRILENVFLYLGGVGLVHADSRRLEYCNTHAQNCHRIN